jgi:hypothetical protein
MSVRGVQWLGDVSYSVYLWHWPLIVLVPYASGTLGYVDQAGIVVVTLVLAAGTKRYVEDRFRVIRVPPGRVFLAAAAATAAVVAMSALQLSELTLRQDGPDAAAARAEITQDPCFGAATLLRADACQDTPQRSTLVPAPVQAAADKSAAYEDVGGKDCWASGPQFDMVTCTFGRATGKTRVALVGNSHAGQWLPALESIADGDDLQITTFLASRCALAEVDQNLPSRAQTTACRDWVNSVVATLVDGGYDAVILTNRMSASARGTSGAAASANAYEAGYVSVLRRLSGRVPVLALRDTPAPGDAGLESGPDCVAEHQDDFAACAGPRVDWVPAEPLRDAYDAVQPADSAFVDLNDAICDSQTCSVVVGGVIVYSDGSHLTATYARTLAPALRPALRKVLSG